MLNPHNTDNSKLGASDYSYFIFDPRETVNEYVPLGYWDGSVVGVKDKLIGYYEFNKGDYEGNEKRDWLVNSVTGETAKLVNQIKTNSTDFKFTEAQTPTDWSSDKRINMNKDKGLNLKNKDKLNADEIPMGILLDAKPSSENFTISFTIQKDEKTKDIAKENAQNYVDILYVGEKEITDKSQYYRAIRDGSQTGSASKSGSNYNRFRGYNDNLNTKVTDINNVFSDTTSHKITLVFQDGQVTSYIDGKVASGSNNGNNVNEGSIVSLSDYNIIFKGFDNNYDGAELFVDNIAVFDTALTSGDVENLDKIIKSESDFIACNECFYDDESEDSIGMVSNYFVGLAGGTPAWYYVNYDSKWEEEYFNESVQSCKRFWGIPNVNEDQLDFTDNINVTDERLKETNTGFKYTAQKNTPTEFYIDSAGYLRCFFTSSAKQDTANASYVYFKDDSNYVKTEALQHAIGSFTTMLDEVSPESKISAVRFSSDKIPDDQLDKLVLLDWTNDPIEAEEIMSLDRGDGGTVKGTPSDPTSQKIKGEALQQYNYGLTGGTATNTGLKAFKENLKGRTDESADKYLIIFTDGKDSTGPTEQEKSKQIAEELKNDGYTIFGVMLTGGSVEYSDLDSSDYQLAKKFLLTLVGDSTTTEEDREKFFYSTAKNEASKDNSIDALTKIFTDEILTRITYNLKNYTVEDYIDPRFDLVSADNTTYYLNADGKVSIKNTDGTTTEYNLKNDSTSVPEATIVNVNTDDKSQKYIDVNLSNSSNVEKSACNASLYYNSDKKMYYLKWEEQTIPGCVPNADVLSVWNAEFTIKAKEDFIGGNAVLTNGNDEKENWVYYEEDSDRSSGIDDAFLKEKSESEDTIPKEGEEVGTMQTDSTETTGSDPKEDLYPSKGFPRTTVNVPPSNYEYSESQTIYMGEKINKEELSKKLLEDIYNNKEDMNVHYYLEYLSRYAQSLNKSLDDYKNDLIKGNKISIPYYYLPNSQKTNNTGTEEHEKDQLGTLDYQIITDCLDYCPEDSIIKDRKERKLIFTVKYNPFPIGNKEEESTESTVKETSAEEIIDEDKTEKSNREILNNTLVKESNYKWDKEFKPVVGQELEEKELIKGEHKTDEVSGEIALQLVLTPDVQEVIADEELTYSIDLMRKYDGTEKEKVGTFTAKYKKADIPQTSENAEPLENQNTPQADESLNTNDVEESKEPSEEDKSNNKYEIDTNGNVTILATIEYSENYLTENGLPIGTYTLENAKITDFKNLKFELPNVITDVSQYISTLYNLGSDKDHPESNLASFKENNVIVLGDTTDTQKLYTNYRFGLLRVTPITQFELPETGKTSLIQLYGFIIMLCALGFIIEIKKKINNNI